LTEYVVQLIQFTSKYRRGKAYKIVCSEWNVIKKVHLQFLSNQGGSICIPIQTHFFSERKRKWGQQNYLGEKAGLINVV